MLQSQAPQKFWPGSSRLCSPWCRPWWAADALPRRWRAALPPACAPRRAGCLKARGWKICAGPSDFQALHHAPMLQMLADDFVQIALVHIGVPDAFRINHQHRPLIARPHAARRVDAHGVCFCGQPQGFLLVLDVIAHLLRTEIVAAILSGFALISAEENMLVKVTHKNNLMKN